MSFLFNFLFVLIYIQYSAGLQKEAIEDGGNGKYDPLFVLEVNSRVEYSHLGEYVDLNMPLNTGHRLLSCYVQPPSGEEVQLKPEAVTENPIFEVPDDSNECSVRVGPISDSEAGSWFMRGYMLDSLDNVYEIRKTIEVRIIGSLIGDESSIEKGKKEVSPKNDVQPTYTINTDEVVISVSTGDTAELTLQYRTGHSLEACFIQRLNEDMVELKPANENTRDDLHFDNDYEEGCRVYIGPVSDENAGTWTQIAWIYDSIGTLYETRTPYLIRNFDIVIPNSNRLHRDISPKILRNYDVEEIVDESIPLITEDTEEVLVVEGGRTLLSIPQSYYHSMSGCYVETNKGEKVQFKPESNNTDEDIRLQPGSFRSDCRIQISNVHEDKTGEWTISTYNYDSSGSYYERRKTYVLKLEENSEQDEISVEYIEDADVIGILPSNHIFLYSGQDLYIRLNKTIKDLKSCSLMSTNGILDYDKDPRYPRSCGLIIHDLKVEKSGLWELVANTNQYQIVATLNVDVQDLETLNTNLTFELGSPVTITFGPESASYCRVNNPLGVQVYSGFSRCMIELDRAKVEDAGLWKATVGISGSLKAFEIGYNVEVIESAQTSSCHTMNATILVYQDHRQLICSLRSENTLKTCKFMRPDSTVFIISEGLGNGRYTADAFRTEIKEDGSRHVSCGLYVRTPEQEDFGTWRCSLETDDNIVVGGFIRLAAMSDVENALDKITPEPELKSTSANITATQESGVTLQCRADTKIEYCWFRADNGTIFSVSPGISSTNGIDYVGEGFESGDCGMRISHSNRRDSGLWTCNVGVQGRNDLSSEIRLYVVESPLLVDHKYDSRSGILIIKGTTYDGSPLTNCRFISPKGTGYSTSVSSGRISYESTDLNRGLCQMRITGYTLSDVGSWTVAAQRTGVQFEIMSRTYFYPFQGWNSYERIVLMIIIFLVLITTSVLLVVVFINHHSARNWAYERAAFIRSSFRLTKPKYIEVQPPPYTIS